MRSLTLQRRQVAHGWLTCLAIVAITLPGRVVAAPTVLDFENLAPGTTITTQYAASGVLFDRAFLSNAALFNASTVAHSGSRVLRSDNPVNEFHDPPLVITFTSPQARVKFFAGTEVVAVTGTLRAKNANGDVVAAIGPRSVAPNEFTTEFEATVATPSIVRIEFQLENLAFEAIDDLEFDGEPAAPLPAQAPAVQITIPTDGADLDLEFLNINGTVTGEALSPTVTIRIESRRPPESTAPTFTSIIPLTGNGPTRQFSLPFGGLPLGPMKITVEAENSGGLKGAAVATFTNLPAGIRNRFITEGGAAAVGAFSFGSKGACKIAVYENAGISVDDVGTTHVFRGDILTKWLSLRTRPNLEPGCPHSDERAGPDVGRVQDFANGRIYAGLANGTLYVPGVFVDAIIKRGGDKSTGVPLADPVLPVEPVTRTWLFQQFARPGRPELLPSTFEIRGAPPRLWIERQSWDLSVDTSGTVWEDFACDSNLGPCTVEPAQTSFPPIENAGDKFCGGAALADEKLEVLLEGGRGEWEPIRGNHHVTTPIFGVVTDSMLAGEDFRFSHEWVYNCPLETVRFGCSSDWTLHVTPIGPHEHVAPHQSLFAAGNPSQLELEYERFYAEFVGWMGFPQPRDLIYASGRWIIDCGHDTYKSELHPIHMYSKMKTVTEIIDPFTGLPQSNPFGGQPATRADVWVNGWYPGGEDADHAIEFDIFPPPRPSPTAKLVVNKPADADAVKGVKIEYAFAPAEAPSHVHVKFTAPYRENHVDVWGQVKWEINRGYEGQWYVYWSP